MSGLAVQALITLALLAGAAATGWYRGDSNGASRVQGRWDAAELALQRQAAIDRNEQQRQANSAAAQYEAYRADQERRYANTRTQLRQALSAPISCPAGQTVQVGDVLVPAAAVRRLRDAAGGAASAAQPPASGPGG